MPNGYISRESFSGSANMTKKFSTQMDSLFIVNDGSSDLTFSTPGFTWTLKPGEVFDEFVDPFDTLTITAIGPFRGFVRDGVDR
jgi:hypothetical protein